MGQMDDEYCNLGACALHLCAFLTCRDKEYTSAEDDIVA